jgi:hypothetical protein
VHRMIEQLIVRLLQTGKGYRPAGVHSSCAPI